MSAEPSIQNWFDSRANLKDNFLDKNALLGKPIEPIGDDCAYRRYYRLRDGDQSLILMETLPDHAEIATPGHSMNDFIRIGSYLKNIGLHTPGIVSADQDNGFLLLEDFGDISFKKALINKEDARPLYELAVDVLTHIHAHDSELNIELSSYYQSHVHKGRRRLIDWYVPVIRGKKNEDGLAEHYMQLWDQIESKLDQCEQGFTHIDFHTENLMWLSNENGLKRCGILDFQGAMLAPIPYDLTNLLEDARMDIDDELRIDMINRFCAEMSAEKKENFKNWYRILAAQFHGRVLGQFIRLALLDAKERYLEHIPRLCRYLEKGLNDPILKPLKQFFDECGISFSKPAENIEVSKIKALIRDDAF